MSAGAVKVALFVGLVIVTVGGASTTMLTELVAVAPRLSVATAESVYGPAARLLADAEYGLLLLVSMPNEIVPLKNCTWATLPSLSEASAVIVISAGAVKVALFVGLVIVRVGSAFGLATVTLTGLEVLVAPRLSVALTVRV